MAASLSASERHILNKAGVKYEHLSAAEILAQLGPAYPEMGGSVAKFRKLAAKAGSIAAMSKADRFAYGLAVEKAILSKQRAALIGASVQLEGPCRDIGAALRGQHKAALMACPAKERAARKPAVWESMYAAAMAEKAKRAEAPWLEKSAAERQALRVAPIDPEPDPPSPAAPAMPAPKLLNPAQKAWVTRRAKMLAAA